jgi:signal transduction histidine kinase
MSAYDETNATIARILHIDDDEANRYAVARILKRAGYRVESAGTGGEGLSLIPLYQPDLVILDIQLPDMNGYEVCRQIKSDPQWASLPVLQMSANFTRSEDKVSGLESGADGYLAQPIDPAVLVATVRSLLRVRRAEQTAKAAILEAEHANISKTRFLANMSHEIRTPVAAILGFLRLVRQPGVTQTDVENYLNVIERNSRHLLRLIDDILDVSKVEAGKLLIESIRFSLAELLQDVASLSRFRAKEKSLDFEFRLLTPVPEFVVSDPTRIHQVLTNILSNAIKFTERGKIELEVSYEAPQLLFRVRDSGRGISPEETTKLFQPFVQADVSTTRNYGGSGLGLALTRHLTQHMNGLFVLESSEPGKGSSFVATIAIDPVSDSRMISNLEMHQTSKRLAAPVPSEEGLNGMRVLLVDDSIDNQELLSIFLKRWGAQVSVASDGKEGYELARTAPFDMILMDIQMPLMDGHEVTRKLRAGGFGTPIIALTAHAMSEEKHRCMESGFTHFLPKPIPMDSLRELLQGSAKQIATGPFPSLT